METGKGKGGKRIKITLAHMSHTYIFAAMNLLSWRKRNDLTQAEACEVLGIPQPVISRIERGEVFPRPETLTLLLEKTGGAISPDDIHEVWRAAQTRSGEAA